MLSPSDPAAATSETESINKAKRRLLREATRLFAAGGYHATAVESIVRAAGLSKRMVYHYFGSKEGLYREVLISVYARLEKVEGTPQCGSKAPAEVVAALFDAYFSFLNDNPDFVRILLWENLNEGRAIRSHGHLLSKSSVLAKLKATISSGINDGIFRPDVDARHLFINLVGLCFIYHSNRHTLSQALDIDLANHSVIAQARLHARNVLFKGILAGCPPHTLSVAMAGR